MQDRIESFTEHLAHELETNPPKRKGERTRDRIKLAAARVLEENGFHAMRVGDITSAAGASDGVFYMYFKDKKDVALQVLEEFLNGMQLAGEPAKGEARSPFESIRRANLRWIQIVRANAGLMRSVLQLSDGDPEFAHLVHTSNRAWYRRVATSVIREHKKPIEPFVAVFAASALGAMMDELTRRVVVYPDQEFVEFLAGIAPDDDALATALSVIWMRVLYPGRRLPADLAGLAQALGAMGSRVR